MNDAAQPMAVAFSELDAAEGKIWQRTAVFRWRLVAINGPKVLEQLWLVADGSGEWREIPSELQP
jgi:hypothetical protein